MLCGSLLVNGHKGENKMGKTIKVTNIVDNFEFKEEIFKEFLKNPLCTFHLDDDNILFKKLDGDYCTIEELEQLFLVLRATVMFKDSRREYEELLKELK